MEFGAPITSRSNARVKALRSSFSGRASNIGETVGIEGEHLIAEALKSEFELETIFLRQGSEGLLERPSLAGLGRDKIVLLSADVFDSAVDTASPQGVAATLAIPLFGAKLSLASKGPALLLEGLQDPGNVGTLLRSAEAFDVPFVWMTNDCANPWSPKVMRASAGSVFRIPVHRGTLTDHYESLKEGGFRFVAAVAPGRGARSLFDIHLGGSCAVMIGNEGTGLSAEALALADELVTIPCEIESLNAAVAGSTILYEAMRQRFVQEVWNESLRS
jgi:TrmH family RNA methyltransferase